ncbi:MAG: TetR/AcrR family transcriptional regulator [Acidimicrobiales bacterium]
MTSAIPSPIAVAIGADPTDASVDQTTRRLLGSAIEVFTERGFDKAGVAEIARRAGFTTGAIYARWPGKQDLLLDAVDVVMSHHLLHLLGGTTMSAPDVLASLGADLVVNDDAAGRALLLEAFATARRDPAFRAMLDRRLADENGRLVAIVERGRRDGFVDPALSTEALVTLCQAIGLGFVLIRSVDRPVPAADEWSTVIERLITAVAPVHVPVQAPTPRPEGGR